LELHYSIRKEEQLKMGQFGNSTLSLIKGRNVH
jgi:hypothetical protein